MCKSFSQLQNYNYGMMDPKKKEAMKQEGMNHLKFCCQLYKIQRSNGCYFLHEHPKHATSWESECMQELLAFGGTDRYHSNMCKFGMYQEHEGKVELVKKPTSFMTNAPELGKELSKLCDGKHTHVNLVNGRAKRAELYPEELCYCILKGLISQMHMDGRLQAGQVGPGPAEDEPKQMNILGYENDELAAWDDVTGDSLPIVGVQNARAEEMEEVRKHEVYVKRTVEECWRITGKEPIKTRWLDIKG